MGPLLLKVVFPAAPATTRQLRLISGLLFSFHAAPRPFTSSLSLALSVRSLCWLKSWLLKLATTNHPLRPITTVQ
nr:hypothetical protein CFP56_24709 [Quercus suber]